jgi:hypothetical protein
MLLRRKGRDEELKVAVVQATTEELRSSLCSRTSKLHKDLSLAKKLGLGAGEYGAALLRTGQDTL